MIGLSALIAPTATAAPSSQMTYEQLQADPAFAAYAKQAESQYQKGSFEVIGGVDNLNGSPVQIETFAYDGQVLRNQWGPYGSANTKSTTINYLNIGKEQTCTRRATTTHWGNIGGDKTAKWSCKKGLDDGSIGEIYIQTPMHKAEYLDQRNPGVTFTYEFDSIDPSRMTLNAYTPDGTLAQKSEYFIPEGGSYWFSTKTTSGDRVVKYFVQPLEKSYDPVAWKSLKKTW